MAWAFALSGSTAPGAVAGESTAMGDLRWILYFAGFVFLFSAVMHSVFRKAMAASIGWQTNGFEIELASVSLGLSAGLLLRDVQRHRSDDRGLAPDRRVPLPRWCEPRVRNGAQQNFAPNNMLILVWDFGVSISLVALLVAAHAF